MMQKMNQIQLQDPYANLSANQTIYYLLISNVYSECRFIGTYTIGVDPLPNIIENLCH